VDRDAATDANPTRGGELDYFQNQISRKVFSRFSQACLGS